MVAVPVGSSSHRTRIRTAVRFGESKTTHHPTRGEFWQVFGFVLVAAIGEDRVHHQTALHAGGAANAAVAALEFVTDQAIGGARGARSAVLFGQRRPKNTEFAHFGGQRSR